MAANSASMALGGSSPSFPSTVPAEELRWYAARFSKVSRSLLWAMTPLKE